MNNGTTKVVLRDYDNQVVKFWCLQDPNKIGIALNKAILLAGELNDKNQRVYHVDGFMNEVRTCYRRVDSDR